MGVKKEYIRKLLGMLRFQMKNGNGEMWLKSYKEHNDYVIKVDFDNAQIIYEDENSKGRSITVSNKATSNFQKEENFVVLECVDRLLEKGYKPESLILEYGWSGGHSTSDRLDIMVKRDGKSYLMIECKTWDKEFKKEKVNMLLTKKVGSEEQPKGQLLTYCWHENTTEFLCLYTSVCTDTEIKYENAIISVEKQWRNLANALELYNYWNKSFKVNGIFEESIKPYHIEPKSLLRKDLAKLTDADSSRIFNQFLEILRHNSVSDKPNAFNKILNLFICKIIDEDRNDEEELLFQWKDDSDYVSLQSNLEDLYKQGMDRFLGIEVTDYSDRDIEKSLAVVDERSKNIIKRMFQELRLQKNPEFAFKEVYNQESFEENAKVLKEVVELLQPYQFRYGHKQQFLGNFFELLLNTSIKQESGQFFTPVPIARYMISSLPIKDVIDNNVETGRKEILPVVIDYACGAGHFLTEYMDVTQSIINEYDTSNMKPRMRNAFDKWKQSDVQDELQGEFEWAKDYVYGIEKDYRLVKTTKISTFLNGDGEANIIHADGLDKFTSEKYKGMLSAHGKENEKFDFVIANPPYSVSAFKQTLPSNGEDFDTYGFLTENSSEIECLFVERTEQLLRENGCAAIILPVSILTNTGALADKTRDILLRNFHIKAVSNHSGGNTFMATDVKTIIVFIQKRSRTDTNIAEKIVDDFMESHRDFSYGGITNVVKKYVSEAFDNLLFEDYILLLNNEPNQKIKETDFYIDFEKKFKKSKEYKDIKKKKNVTKEEIALEIKAFEKKAIIASEKRKLLYYLLLFNEKTILIKTGEKQAEKDFLGYEFAKRRGNEGIHPYTDENGCIISSLYDEEDLNGNPDKVNYYIYQAFNGNYPSISDSLKDSMNVVSSSSLLDFKSADFENRIFISPREYILPSQYNQIKIERVVTMPVVRGKSTQYGESDIQVIKSGQIRGEYEFDFTEKYFADEDYISDDRNLQKGDILINSTGVGTAGRVNLFELNGKYVVDSHVAIVRLDKTKIKPEYVLYVLKCIGFKNIESLATGQSGQIELTPTQVENLKVPFPPMPIQEKLCEENKKMEEIIEEKKKIIKSIEKKKENEISDIFYKGFADKFLGDEEYVSLRRGPFGGSLKKEIFVPSGYKVYEQKHAIKNDFSLGRYYVTEEKYKEMSAFQVMPGDIIMSCSGTIGKFAIVPFDAKDGIINQALLRFRATEKLLPEFLKVCLEHITLEFTRKSHGKGIQNVTSVDTLKTIKIPVPNDKDEQKQIVNKVKEYEEQISELENEIELLRAEQYLLVEKYL